MNVGNYDLTPNTVQVPNDIFDKVMPIVSHAEFKVIMAIVRKTYGWRKHSDRISLRQIMAMTGVSNRAVINAVRKLDWLICSSKNDNGTMIYWLNLDKEGKLSPTQSGELSSPVVEIIPQETCELSSPFLSQSGELSSQSGELSSPTTPTNNTQESKPTNKRVSDMHVTKQPKEKQRRVIEDAEPILPQWLEKETWDDFLAMRKSIKAPMTMAAKKLTIRKLADMVADGQDANLVLEQSIERSWRGVFPVQTNQGGANGYQREPRDRLAGAKEFFRELHAGVYDKK